MSDCCEPIDHVRALLIAVGENPNREGLMETPARYVKALREMTSGYAIEPLSLLKTFGDGADNYDQMVVLRRAPFYSLCEHHLAPFFGEATIAYIPSGRVVGLSKLARLLDCYARRLQVQERLTQQIASALNEGLSPQGVGVYINARHLCMESRGIRKPGSSTITSALYGALREDAAARAEFMSIAESGR